MRVRAVLAALSTTALLGTGFAGVAQADSVGSGDFEGFAVGDVHGQQGWTNTGSYDVNIVNPSTFGVTDMGSRALQMSNARVSGSFGDQAFSAPLADEAGESDAENNGLSGGSRQSVFTTGFSVRTTSAGEQEGLYASISPDRGDGARMSYLRLEDTAGGVDVFFDDYSGGEFVETKVATLSRSAKHTIGLTMVFVDGPANDMVRVSVDGSLVHTGTSWEDYFRDVEGKAPRTVDSLLFRVGGGAANARPSLAGQGFLFDDLELTSASSAPCAFTVSGTTMTLVDDCTTDHTILVPGGSTLDGDGHTITAVDPAAGHFVGAVVRNSGTSANVTDLGVTTSGLADLCDGGDDRLRGIMLDGASGAITNNSVVDLRQVGSGCQEGNAIEVRNAPFDTTGPDVVASVTGNEVSGYQKTGVLVNGSVVATVADNAIGGLGPVPYIAQNGVQIGFGATATVSDNTIAGNVYTGTANAESCGLLFFQADGVKQRRNSFEENQRSLCNFGRGGGSL